MTRTDVGAIAVEPAFPARSTRRRSPASWQHPVKSALASHYPVQPAFAHDSNVALERV
jgi:hypothetical protein